MVKKVEDEEDPLEPRTIAYVGNRKHAELNGQLVKRHTVVRLPRWQYDTLVYNRHWMDGEMFVEWKKKYDERKAKRQKRHGPYKPKKAGDSK